MSAKDYGEPWTAIDSPSGMAFPMDRGLDAPCNTPAQVLRAVACVNACAGLDDPSAEIARLKSENDRLRAELTGVEAGYEREKKTGMCRACGRVKGGP